MRKANGLDEFYSRYKSNGDFEYFVDNYGNYKMDYPHIHVVFFESRNIVSVIASQSRDNHAWRINLNDPDGNEVNRAISEASDHISW